MPELFRIATDGCGRLLALAEDELSGVWRVLATEQLGISDQTDDALAHLNALRRLVERITPNLVDPVD
jgi:hypothetical protein